MKALFMLLVMLVAVAPVWAQSQTAVEDAEEERAVEALNNQLAKLEDSAGLGGEGYTDMISGNRMFCDFFAQIQQVYPLYKDMTCRPTN